MSWFVYIIEASDHSFYTGITTDLERRFSQHVSGRGGARYFRGREAISIKFSEEHNSRSAASQREAQIKKLCRSDKIKLIEASEDLKPTDSRR
ncbi:MAG: endonuclease [Porticoccaceae bacterium]|nr:endonuclease [Porticoccaceae bacterium]